ncbi:MAG: hypothetical protein HYX40_03310 [Sphingobacteriales bacterium]|nr:hypothetical protein [Sphingobacteriales bacterium]
MKRILTLPTWQVFILFIIPAIFPSSYLGLILTLVWASFIGVCVYTVANSLHKKLPEYHELKIKRFNFYLLFALVYFIIVVIVFEGGYEINQDNYKDYGWAIAVIIPLHLFMMYCVFYLIWFIAKAIATVENKRVVFFETYAANFFLLWFFPIGVWFVHSKILKIFSETTQ